MQDVFWNTKPPEELYDLVHDPDEVANLADSLQHQAILAKFAAVQRDLILKIRDVGFLPEGEIHTRSASGTPYDTGHDPASYPLEAHPCDRGVGLQRKT